jgi:type IV secretion system protein VirD4
MSNGLILGLADNPVSRWQGLKSLFDRRLPSNRAVRRFLKSMQRKQKPSLVRLNNAVHTAVFAPTGAGKGVSSVIPFLLTCPESCVVIDFKGETTRSPPTPGGRWATA